MKIDRTLFWFNDGDESLLILNEDFFGLGILLNRLLNEKYDGKKIKFININFSTNKTYELHPIVPKNGTYYYGGHLQYYGILNKEEFDKLNWAEKNNYIWERACQYISKSAEFTKNKKLLDAVKYAYKKGLEINLNPNYRLIEVEINIFGQQLKASVWIDFKQDGMYSRFTIEKNEIVIFERAIDKTKNGIEFFLEMYKGIELDKNNIIIKGHKDVDSLPLRIPLSEVFPMV